MPMPENVSPLRLARAGESLAGRLPVSEMPRVALAIGNSKRYVDFDLRFRVDEQGRACVDGEIGGEIELGCQRCLGPTPWRFESPVRLAVVTTDAEADALEPEREPLQVGETSLLLATLVEDEVLLALPAMPVHADGACHVPAGGDDLGEGIETRRDNPFAALEQLKKI